MSPIADLPREYMRRERKAKRKLAKSKRKAQNSNKGKGGGEGGGQDGDEDSKDDLSEDDDTPKPAEKKEGDPDAEPELKLVKMRMDTSYSWDTAQALAKSRQNALERARKVKAAEITSNEIAPEDIDKSRYHIRIGDYYQFGKDICLTFLDYSDEKIFAEAKAFLLQEDSSESDEDEEDDQTDSDSIS